MGGPDEGKEASKMGRGKWAVALAVVVVLLVVMAAPGAYPQTGDWAATVAREATPAVVTIEVYPEAGEESSQGSGFIVSPDGLVVTNYHVVKGSSFGLVRLPNGSFFVIQGAVRASLPLATQDLIVLKCDGRGLPTLQLGASAEGSEGRNVVAIGSPLGLEATVSTGVVSAIRELRPGVKVIQTTAPVSHGSSGGPLLDSDGRVVGVNSAFLSEGQNLNFAVLVGSVKELLAGLDDASRSDTVALADLERALAGEATGSVSGGEVVRAHRFEVVDARGRVRATLGMHPDGSPSLWLFDEEGESRVEIDLLGGCPNLTLRDESGEGRAALSLGAGGSPDLALYDDKGEARATLAIHPDGSPILGLYDQKGERRAQLAVLPDGSPSLWLSDGKGELRAGLALLADGSQGLHLYDQKGERRAALAMHPDGSPGLALYDQKGQARAWLGVLRSGSPGLRLFDKDEKVLWEAP